MVARARRAAWLVALAACAPGCNWRLHFHDADGGDGDVVVHVPDAPLPDGGMVCGSMVRGTAAGFPRQIAPRSMATTDSSQPVLAWTVPEASALQVDRVRLCPDRAMCGACQDAVLDPAGGRTTANAIAPGVWFWALHARDTTGADLGWSAVHEFVVPNHASPALGDRSHGALLDVDGDGRPELATATLDGRVSLWRWHAAGFAPIVTLPAGPSGFGARFAPAGDVDGDGYGDLVVGACARPVPGAGAPCSREAFVFYGDPVLGVRGGYATLHAPAAGAADAFGATVAAAGDVDSDGYADVLVGAPGADASVINALRTAYVFFGGPAGIDTAGAPATIPAPQNGTFGWSLAGPGDLDADGYDDVVVGVGASAMTGTAPQPTQVFVYRGRALMRGAATPVPSVHFFGYGDHFGYALVAAGDVDGDGNPDVAIGSTGGPAMMAHVWIFPGLGTASLLAPMPMANEMGASDTGLGTVLAGGGDVNGDGLEDVAYAAPAGGPMGNGQVYVLSAPAGASPQLATISPGAAFTTTGFGTSLAIVGPIMTGHPPGGSAHSLLVVGAPGMGAGQVAVFDLLASPDPGTLLAPSASSLGFGAWLARADDGRRAWRAGSAW